MYKVSNQVVNTCSKLTDGFIMFLSVTLISLYMFNSFVIKKLLFSVSIKNSNIIHSLYVTVWVALKRAVGFLW